MSDQSKSNISLDAGFHFHEVDPKSSHTVETETRRLLSLNPSLAALLTKTIALPPATATLDAQTNVVSEPLGDLTGFVNPVDPTLGLVFAGYGFQHHLPAAKPEDPHAASRSGSGQRQHPRTEPDGRDSQLCRAAGQRAQSRLWHSGRHFSQCCAVCPVHQ